MVLRLLLLAALCLMADGNTNTICSGPRRHCTCHTSFARCTGSEIQNFRFLKKKAFGQNLDVFYIDHADIRVVPSNAFQTTELFPVKELKLINSGIDKIRIKAFSDLSQLKLLDLQNNSISTLGENIFASNGNLSVLRIGNNKITKIKFISNLNNLKVLQLDHNKIQNIQEASFCSSPSFNSRVETLILNHNNIRSLHRTAFQCLKHLVILDVSYNQINVVKAHIFRHLINLQYLKLSHNHITRLHGLWHLPSVMKFHLDHNLISSIPAGLLARNNTLPSRLRELHLENNKLVSIHEHTFNFATRLNFVFLQNNNLTVISDQTFVSNNQLLLVDVRNNSLNSYTFVNLETTKLLS